mmetsp:Transcript_14762/g.48237  ORF Transcript_14762/g.48237 Transcript_14762/m.48237 type:complete len:280 (-) Transcript_14762:541-1380(-)
MLGGTHIDAVFDRSRKMWRFQGCCAWLRSIWPRMTREGVVALMWYLALSWVAMLAPSPMGKPCFCFFFGFVASLTSRPVNFGWRLAGIQAKGTRSLFCFSSARIRSTLAWSALLYVRLNFAHADVSSSFFAVLILPISVLKKARLRPASEFAAPPTCCRSPEVRRATLTFSSGSASSVSSFPRPNVGSVSAPQLTSDESAGSDAAAARRFFVLLSAASCFQYGAAVKGYRPGNFQAIALFASLNARGHDMLRHSRTSLKFRARRLLVMKISTCFICLSL